LPKRQAWRFLKRICLKSVKRHEPKSFSPEKRYLKK
jgi:hypothetical protein